MRIYISTSPGYKLVPYNYLQVLTGTIHKWLDTNRFHDEVSLYSFSMLKGAVNGNRGLRFPGGANWFISSHSEGMLKKLVSGIREDAVINYGMFVREVMIRETPLFTSEERFTVASPVFVKRRINGREKHFLYSDKESNELLTETMATKLSKAGLSSDGVSVRFDNEFHNPKTKLLEYRGIKNRANICPVIIKGTPEQIAFAWNVGVGNSTGIGFGALD